MPSEVLGGRYAEALINAIDDIGHLEEVNAELQAIAKSVDDNPQFKAFLEGPNVRTEDKHALALKVFGGKVEQISLDFVKLLIDKHRLDHLGEAAKQFQKLVEARRNQIRVKVTTAIPLAVDMADRMKRALDVVTGKDCILDTSVDVGIVGGVVVIVDDRVIDGSIRTALGDLKKDLMGAPL